MKNLFLTTLVILSSIITKAQSSIKISNLSTNINQTESKISKKIKLDDVIVLKQPLVSKNNRKKVKSFQSKITIDNDYDYLYVVFYDYSKSNSIVKLNPIGNSKSVDFDKLVKLGDFKNLDSLGKRSIALDDY